MGAIAVFTETGNTARMISKYRPNAAIHAFTHNAAVAQRTNLYWGVHPVKCAPGAFGRRHGERGREGMLGRGLLKPGDVLGVVAGTRQASGSTNFMRLHTVTSDEVSASQLHSPNAQHAAARQKL